MGVVAKRCWARPNGSNFKRFMSYASIAEIHLCGSSCLEDSAADRPTILEVISMLKNEIVPLPILKKTSIFHGKQCH